MMPKSKITISVLLVLFLFSGCKDLQEVPSSSLSVENLYQNEADVDRALIGIYKPPQGGINDIWFMLATSGPSPDMVARLRQGAQGRFTSVNFIPSDPQSVMWDFSYQGINRANSVIANASKAGLSEELENEKIAEARFMRAYYYFLLVRMFGGVPLHTDETTSINDEAVKKPRSSVEEVFNLIVEDLKFAEQHLPPKRSAKNFGRASGGMAKAYLGKVYLRMAGLPLGKSGYFQKAADKLQEVVDSGLYSLLTNFGDIFKLSNEANQEIIFARTNLRQTFDGNVLTFFSNPPSSPFAFAGGQYQFAFTESFYNSYDSNDERRDATLMRTYTDLAGRQVTYNDPNNPSDLPAGGYKDPNGIALGKYKDPNNNKDPFSHSNDIILLRYADVLLMLAESYNEVGNSAQALNYLNQVRNRANLGDVVTTNQVQLRDIIKQERKWELAGEFTEYFDLQRWGDLEESMQNNADAQLLGTSYAPRFELYPIPQSQIDANENLEQNPGY